MESKVQILKKGKGFVVCDKALKVNGINVHAYLGLAVKVDPEFEPPTVGDVLGIAAGESSAFRYLFIVHTQDGHHVKERISAPSMNMAARKLKEKHKVGMGKIEFVNKIELW